MNLDALAEAPTDALPHLVSPLSQLENANEVTREIICSIFESCGPPLVQCRGELQSFLGKVGLSPPPAYWCISVLAGDVAATIPAEAGAIAKHLSPDNPLEVRQRAAWALGRLASVATATQTALDQAATDPNTRLARLANRSVGHFCRK